MKFLQDVDVKNKRVLVRADFNIFLDTGRKTEDDFRIRAVLPTINYLLKNQAKIVLMSHLGRPEGKIVENLRLNRAREILTKYLDVSVAKAPDCFGSEIEQWTKQMQSGEILLLENLRFHAGEEENDINFAKQLARLGDIYVNDAFGVSHRQHASVCAITKFLPSVAGLLLESEIKNLDRALKAPKSPMVVIIGGVKISTKIRFIENFLKKAEYIILGGALANTVLFAKGLAIGKSIIEKEMLPEIKKLNLTDGKMHIPLDVVVAINKIDQSSAKIVGTGRVEDDEIILDIGPETINLFSKIIKEAKTIIWNGPMGYFEVPAFSRGSEIIAKAIADNQEAFSIVGGGETIALINEMGLVEKFDHISTGGGAMLAFLAGEKLPGIEALKSKKYHPAGDRPKGGK